MLEVRGLSSGYGNVQVLWNVDLTVERGEWVALVGAVGAGKTTLLRTIAGTLPSFGGEIVLEGAELAVGLAPVVVASLLEALVVIRAEGTTLLVVEQDVQTALEVSDRAYLMR